MSTDKVKWNMYNTCKLIQFYKENPLLWNPNHSEYKSKYRKIYVLTGIANSLNVSYEEIDRKLKNLLSQYCRETRYYNTFKKTGTGGKFRSKWYGYPLLNFLDHKKNKPSQDEESPEKNEDSSIVKEEKDEDSEEEIHEIEDEDECETIDIKDNQIEFKNNNLANKDIEILKSQNTSLLHQFQSSILQQIEKKANNNVPERISVLISQPIEEEKRTDKVVDNSARQERASHNNGTGQDDFDVFGDLVARKIRNLSTRYAQVTLQRLINNLLYDAELGLYDAPATRRRTELEPLHSIFLPSSVTSTPSVQTSYSNPLNTHTTNIYG